MKAIALYSGGLDSSLAIKIVQQQGVEVVAVYFNIGFDPAKERQEKLQKAAKELGVMVVNQDIREQFVKDVLFKPVYGYGKNFNPCVDCHANMIKHALLYMKEVGASFIITGEVVGQRGMSQGKARMELVDKLSEHGGLVVRPLCAKLLAETIPEQKGWLDREKLLDIEGKNRSIQLRLAQKFKITTFSSPAGGCLLTDEAFSKRLRSFVLDKEFEITDIPVLRVGRHLCLPEKAKLIIARNEAECAVLEKYSSAAFTKIIPADDVSGPTALLSKSVSSSDRELAEKIVNSYTKLSTKPVLNKEDIKKYFI